MNEIENLTGSQRDQLKTVMMKELDRLQHTDARTWEQATFQAVTGEPAQNVDWDIQENVAGYRLWMGTFEQIAKELEADGYVEFTHFDSAGLPFVRARPLTPEQTWA